MENEQIVALIHDVDARSKSNTHRIDKIEVQQEAITRIASSVEVIANEQRHQTEEIKGVKATVSALDGKVDAIEQKPGKRWESIVEKAVMVIITAIITYCLARIGLSA